MLIEVVVLKLNSLLRLLLSQYSLNFKRIREIINLGAYLYFIFGKKRND